MTPSFLVEYFEATGVLDIPPRGMNFRLTLEDGEIWYVNLRRYQRRQRFLGQRITVTGPRCGPKVIEAMRIFVHEEGGQGYWAW